MKNRIVITIDGLSGSGKTTLSKALAAKLNFIHFNSGSLYRVVAYLTLCNNLDPQDQESILRLLANNKIEFKPDTQNSSVVLLNSVNIENQIRAPQISEMTSKISVHAKLREALLEMQRNIFSGQNVVVEGRDMGTVVFPEAVLKFYIEADENVRKQRRLKQLASSKEPEDNSLNLQIKSEISERDQRDASRAVAPVRPAEDAIIIDNSTESLTKVIQRMYDTAATRLGLAAAQGS